MKRNNLVLGLIGGLIAAIVGAAIWAGITVATGMQIGYVAIGIGFLVGFAIRLAGKGDTVVFSIVGGSLALFACVLGNFMSIIGFYAKQAGIGVMDALGTFPYGQTIELMTLTFSPMDLLFYGIAGYCGWKYAIDEEHINYDDYEPNDDDQHGGAPPVFGPGSNQ